MKIIQVFIKRRQRFTNPFAIQSGRLGSLRASTRISWTEEAYIGGADNRQMVGRNFNIAKLYIFVVVLVVLLGVLLGRLAWLQLKQGNYYYALAEGNRIRLKRLEPRRGIIYDRNYRSLVRNQANFLLYILPVNLPTDASKREAIFNRLADILGAPLSEEVKKKIASIKPGSPSSFEPIFISDNLEYERAVKLYLEADKMSGVVLTVKDRRSYEFEGMSLSHVLGYVGKISAKELEQLGDDYTMIDYVGKTGIENFWESELRGHSGFKKVEVDALGREKRIISQERAQDGHNLVLSIDSQTQANLEQIINRHLEDREVKRAAAVVLDPNNGEVIALVSIPSFDNNWFARGIKSEEYQQLISHPDNPLFNRAIRGEYPSGSTIKPVIAAAALEEGIISERTTFHSTGGLKIGRWFFPDWLAGGHGWVDVRSAIANSVNTFFYYIGGGYKEFEGLGVERIVQYSKLFGLGSPTGIDLSGEADGLLPTPEWKQRVKGERWYIGDTYHLAIGQGDLLATPLQVANFTAVFANGGKLYRPHLVKRILKSDDSLWAVVPIDPIRENFISPYNLKIVREGMRQTVTRGSARSLQEVPVAVAGKTGTAQWSRKGEPHAWFTGFAPFKDPKIVITVLVEQGGEGSHTAVPIVKDFLNWYFGEREKGAEPPQKTEGQAS